MKKREWQTGSPGDIEWHFLEARRLMDSGKIRAAMEVAGYGIRLDLRRPEGYLLLGELNLLDGDLLEARRSFTAAAARSRGETRCGALAGLAQVAWLAGDLAASRSAYEDALREDKDDPLNLRPALVEVLLRLGDLAAAKRTLAASEDESPDVHLLSALLRFKLGDASGAAVDARRACLANVYLPHLLLRTELPDFGLVHGIEEAGPEHARALVEGLRPLLAADPDAAAFLVRVAGDPVTRRECAELVSVAGRLQVEPEKGKRAELLAELDRLRDPVRIAASGGAPQSFDV